MYTDGDKDEGGNPRVRHPSRFKFVLLRAVVAAGHSPRQPLADTMRQRGAALLAVLSLVVVISAGFVLENLNKAVARRALDTTTTEALVAAREAILAWAVSHPRDPGLLPFPDRGNDVGYDGISDCLSSDPEDGDPDAHLEPYLLGKFPWLGDVNGESCGGDIVDWSMGVRPVDGRDETLWYVVSKNLVAHPAGMSAEAPLRNLGLVDTGADGNPAAPARPWMSVYGERGLISDRVAVVIIAPGEPWNYQDRTNLPSSDWEDHAFHFLDEVAVPGEGIIANYDNDGRFVVHQNTRTLDTGERFNDVVTFITIDELMTRLERLVLGDTSTALNRFRSDHGYFPWLAPYRLPLADPDASIAAGIATGDSSTVLRDAAANFVEAGVATGDFVIDPDSGKSGLINRVDSQTELAIQGFDVIAGQNYEVKRATGGSWGITGGRLGRLERTTDWFRTSMVIEWDISGLGPGIQNELIEPPTGRHFHSFVNVAASFSQAFYPTDAGPQFSVRVGEDNARCLATQFDISLRCDATFVLESLEEQPAPPSPPGAVRICFDSPPCPLPELFCMVEVERTYEFQLSYRGQSTSTGPRSVSSQDGAFQALSGLPTKIFVTDVVDLSDCDSQFLQPGTDNRYVIRSGRVTANTGDDASFTTSGIYRDFEQNTLSLSNRSFDYFYDQGWDEYIYVGIAEGLSLAATSDCPGVDCLSINVARGGMVMNGIEAVVVSPGPRLTGQRREPGVPNCATASGSYLCEYFERENQNLGDGVYGDVLFGVNESSVTAGTAALGSADGTLRVVPGDGVLDEVFVGDWAVNVSDGSGGGVTAVSDGTGELVIGNGLSGGIDNTFEPGEGFAVRFNDVLRIVSGNNGF